MNVDIENLDLEPFIGIMSDVGFMSADESIGNPNKKVYKICELGTKKFEVLANETSFGSGEYEDLDYWPKSDAKTWWVGGMQKLIANEVVFVTDGTDDYIYVFYYKQNNREYGSFLGRLRPGSEIERIVKEAFDTICI